MRERSRSLQMSTIKSDVAFIVALLRRLLFVSFSFLFPRHSRHPFGFSVNRFDYVLHFLNNLYYLSLKRCRPAFLSFYLLSLHRTT